MPLDALPTKSRIYLDFLVITLGVLIVGKVYTLLLGHPEYEVCFEQMVGPAWGCVRIFIMSSCHHLYSVRLGPVNSRRPPVNVQSSNRSVSSNTASVTIQSFFGITEIQHHVLIVVLQVHHVHLTKRPVTESCPSHPSHLCLHRN